MKARHPAILLAWCSWAWALYEWSIWSLPAAVAGVIPYLLLLSFSERKH